MLKKIFKTLIILSVFMFYLSNSLQAGYYNKGRSYYVYKRYNKAKEMFLKAVEKSDNGDAYYFLGEIEKIEGNYEMAKEYYQTAITKRISKKYLRLAYWNLIVLTERQGDYLSMVKSLKIFWDRTRDAGAKKKVETLINKLMWSDDKEAKRIYQKGIELKKRKKLEDAEHAFKEAAQKDPSFLAAKFEIGLLEYQKGDIGNAIYYFREIIDKIPFYGEVHLLLGDIYFTKQRYRYAIEHFNNALEYGFIGKNTKNMIKLNRGKSYFNLRDYASAKDDILSALKIKHSGIEPLLLLSAIYIKESNYKEALKTLQIAMKSDQNNPEIIFQIGSIYYRIKDARYVLYFDKLFNLVNNNRSRVPQKYYRAFILLLKKHFSDSKYKRVTDISENLPETLKDYETNLLSARSYFYMRRYEKAINYLERLSLKDEDKYMLSKAYAKSRMADKAKGILLQLYYNESCFQRALKDNTLKKIASEIVQGKNTKPEINDKQN